MSFETDITPRLLQDSGTQKIFAGEITPDWFVVVSPNGGFIAALLLRTMNLAQADTARLARTLTIDFISPPKVEGYEITTQIIRQGKGLTSVKAEMKQGEVISACAVATFAKTYLSPLTLAHEPPPQASSYEEAPLMPLQLPIHKQFEMKAALGSMPFDGSDDAECGGWTKLHHPPDQFNAEMLAIMSDCWPPALFGIISQDALAQPRGMTTIELSVYFIQPEIYPSLNPADPVLARFKALENLYGFFTEDGDMWTADGTLLARSRQLAIAL